MDKEAESPSIGEAVPIVCRWEGKARDNIEEWGLQDRETLLLAMQEEVGELSQAHLESEHEGGETSRIDKELDDLAALVIQMFWRLNGYE